MRVRAPSQPQGALSGSTLAATTATITGNLDVVGGTRCGNVYTRFFACDLPLDVDSWRDVFSVQTSGSSTVWVDVTQPSGKSKSYAICEWRRSASLAHDLVPFASSHTDTIEEVSMSVFINQNGNVIFWVHRHHKELSSTNM